jgi:hypothetical protein
LIDGYIIGNAAINMGLVGAVLYFGKKWMASVETTAILNRNELKKDIKDNHDELKKEIKENCDEYKHGSERITASIEKLSEHVAIANGRTAKLEGKIETQEKLCSELIYGRRQSDKATL